MRSRCSSVGLFRGAAEMFIPLALSGHQVRPQQFRPLLLEQGLEDLPVGQALVDLLTDVVPYGIRHAAAVGVAAGQRVEVPRAGVLLDAARAVNAAQEPLDPLLA